ncbi:lysylphosphatidylglycerol synthase transmembrane domain-containing protein [Bradymonas sediminis]|uniref:Uncharacterized protein n=1 Tax=Bradymonas sediminis TaxID=1548548 RepID=A0A2Z4FMY4_9DELT|nr:lysylphosphatidylglycerol synthase transmembrane domain-containing protein [Bradymonas sediminis]AWV90126.1 hypothetical protein DN745_12600 [Bradymonas sediminis]TDP75905.1 hypothetical protein DFR33_103253 [Bradymonas sediminis]
MRRFAVYFIIANIIGGFFLWLASRSLPLDHISAYLKGADLGHLGLWAGVFLAIYSVSHWARVYRWSFLVRPLDESIPPMTIHRVCAVGFTAILLLPLRLGELVRPYLLSRRTDLSLSAVLGTTVVERVIDGLLITGLLFVTLAFYDGSHETAFATYTGIISALIFVPALLVCILTFWRKEWMITNLRRIGSLVSAGITAKLLGLLDDFIEGFRGLLKADYLGRFIGITALYWFTNIASMWVFASMGFGLELSLWQMTTVLPILVIGIMIPAGPGMAGNFEFFMARGIALFLAIDVAEVGAKVAVFAATVHVLQFLAIIIPGFVVMWTDPEARHLIRLSSEAEEESPSAEDAPA